MIEKLKQEIEELNLQIKAEEDKAKKASMKIILAQKKAELAVAKENEKKAKEEAKLADAKKKVSFLSAQSFIKTIESYLPIQVDTSVKVVHFQNKEKDGERKLFCIYDDFEYCVFYTSIEMENNEFYDWMMQTDGTFTIPMDVISIIKKLKYSKGSAKGLQYVVKNIKVTQAKYVIEVVSYETDDKDIETVQELDIEIKRSAKQYSEKVRKSVPLKFIYNNNGQGYPINWITNEDAKFVAYHDNDTVNASGTNKIIDVEKCYLFPIQKGENTFYTMFLTEKDKFGCQFLQIISASEDRKFYAVQAMKTI